MRSYAKYPIREWLGKYESFLLRLYGRDRWIMADRFLERFLSAFPNAEGWEDFTAADINDYRLWLSGQRTNSRAVFMEIDEVSYLYRWMQEDCGLSIHNPVPATNHLKARPESKNRLGLSGTRRLIAAADGELKKWILCQIMGDEYRGELYGRSLRDAFLIAARKADLNWLNGIAIFRKCVLGIWRDIIKQEYGHIALLIATPSNGSFEWEDVT